FKQQLFQAQHNFDAVGGNTFYLALYTSAATIDASTTVYTTSNEVSSVGTNYPAGGGALTSLGVSLSSATAFLDFNDLTFPNVTLTARGCMIYNSTNADKAVAVFDFGSDKTATDGDFTVIFPAATASTAVIRLT
ncbi:hypothetical protein EBT31_22505, partial [bacterium]|nr:hypothetical protein [bacterium]